jgi:prophage tail gpP-like protein
VPNSRVELRLNSDVFSEWESARVERTVESPSGRFNLRVLKAGVWRWNTGTPAKIAVDGLDLLSEGHIDRVQVGIGSDSGGVVTLTGRDKTGDLVDSSADHEGGWLNAGVIDIAKTLCAPHGITAKAVGDLGPTFDTYAVQPGETGWETLVRALRLRNLLAWPSSDGTLQIGKPGQSRAETTLVEGGNVKSATLIVDDSKRFGKYIVRGQMALLADDVSGQWSAEQLAGPEGTASDALVRSNRVMIVLADGPADDAICGNMATWYASTRAAVGAEVIVPVQGWHQTPDRESPLWEAGLIVPASLPGLGIDQDMLIKRTTFDKSGAGGGSGETCELHLVHPDAYDKAPTEDPGDAVRSQYGWEAIGTFK